MEATHRFNWLVRRLHTNGICSAAGIYEYFFSQLREQHTMPVPLRGMICLDFPRPGLVQRENHHHCTILVCSGYDSARYQCLASYPAPMYQNRVIHNRLPIQPLDSLCHCHTPPGLTA